MKIIIKFFITFSIFSNNDAVPIKIKTSRIAGTTTHANTFHKENELNNSDFANIEDTKRFLEKNGYDLLSKEIEQAVKYSKFETFKAFSENKAIQETMKYSFLL
jgi:hypothetical protein